MTIKLQIIKIPRVDKIPDVSPNFPSLPDLHLELLENKKKLKLNLPPIQIRKIIKKVEPEPAPSPSPPSPKESPKKQVKESPIHSSEETKRKNSADGTNSSSEDSNDDIMDALGESEDENIKKSKPKKSKPVSSDSSTEASSSNESSSNEEKTKEPVPAPEPEVEFEDQKTPEEKEREEKEMLIWKFNIMRKQYKTRTDIPQYNEHSDYKIMKTNYERLIKEINLDDSASTYRTYLIISFFAIEYFMTYWANIDMTGLAKFHMQSMSKYERLLIELGERPYNNIFNKLPVEVRLLGFIGIQTGLFWIGKMMSQNSPSAITMLFKLFSGTETSTPQPQLRKEMNTSSEDDSEEVPKRKMKGPSVKP